MRRLLAVTFGACALVFSAGCGGGGNKNAAPEIDAGPDQTVDTGDLVSLQGSAQDANERDILEYQWSFVVIPAGSQAVLMNAESTTPSFVADVEGEYILDFVVTDGRIAVADSVTVSSVGAFPTNAYPTPNAGADTTAPVYGQFSNDPGAAQLDGSGSTDPEQDYLFYYWAITAKPTGSVALINDPSLAQPSLFVDVAGQYEVSLWVSDDGGAYVGPDTVIVDAAGASNVALIAGDAQSQMVTSTLATPLSVQVTNEFQDAIRGIAVLFDVTAGAGGDVLAAGVDNTEVDGYASDSWTLGTVTGARTATATAVTYIDEFNNITTLAPVAFNANGESGPAVTFDLATSGAATTVDDGTAVTATGFDAFGNQAADDDATEIDIEATGTALFAMNANVGTVVNGGNSGLVTVRLDGGIADIDLDDNVAETVEISLESQNYAATVGPFALPPLGFSYPDDFAIFSFGGVFPPTENATLTINARGDFGGGNELEVYDNEFFGFYGALFGSAPNCSAVGTSESVTIPQAAQAMLNDDGTAEFLLANFSGLDETACPDNDFEATLSFTGTLGGATVVFGHGSTSQVVLRDPVDVQAGDPMRVEAFAADQYGNLASGDSTTRFSVALSGSNAAFATSADEGVIVAGAGDEIHLRVENGRASVEVSNAAEELVGYQLGDPVPNTVAASMMHDGRFTGAPDAVLLVSGDAQDGTVAQPLANPVVLEVRDASGFTVPGVSLSFATNPGDGALSAPATDRDGQTGATWVLSTTAGTNNGTASVGGSTDAAFTAQGIESAAAIVMLRQPTMPASGANTALVRLEILDQFYNLVPSDSETTFSVEVDGSAVWTGLLTGSAITGTNSNLVLVTVDAGVAEIELTDDVDETVVITHFDSLNNGLSYERESDTVLFNTNFEADDGGLTATGINSSWQYGTPTTGVNAFSGTKVWATNLVGDYNVDEESCLDVSVSIPGSGATTWTSMVRYITEPGFDFLTFESCDSGLGSCDVLSPSLSGDNGQYEEFTFDVSVYAGQVRRLSWCLSSDIIIPDDGIFVDDVSIVNSSGAVTVTFSP